MATKKDIVTAKVTAQKKTFTRGVHRRSEAKTPIEAPLDAKPVKVPNTYVVDQGTPEDAAKQGPKSLITRVVEKLTCSDPVPETTAK